jgi:hypothetical protein
MSVATEIRPEAPLRLGRAEETSNPIPEPKRAPLFAVSVLAGVTACVGVLSVAKADSGSRVSASYSYGLFWLGLGLILIPIAWQLCRRDTSRNERLVLVVVLGMTMYLVKCMYSPTVFVFHDEFAHVRTILNIQSSGRLFGFNPEIKVAADYPGLALVTLGLVKLTGLSIVTSGMVVIGAARVVLMLSIFLLAERLTGSPRVAGVACLIYAGNPNFLYWSAQFAYESLALPLALAVAYLVLRRSDGDKRETALVVLIAAMMIITHHLTTYFVFLMLVAWLVVAVIRRRRGHPDDYLPIVPILFLGVATALWLILAAPATIGYIVPVLVLSFQQGIDVVLRHQSSRVLFKNPGGPVEPIWERIMGLGSVLLIVVTLPFALLRRWRRRAHPLTSVIAWAALLYVLLLPLDLTDIGEEAALRSGDFLFVGIGLALATMLVTTTVRAEHARVRRFVRLKAAWRRVRVAQTTAAFFVCVVIVTGGMTLSWNFAKILAPPPHVIGTPAITTPDVIEAARWFRGAYGPNHRIETDITTGLAFVSYGDQNVLSEATDRANVWFVFFPTTMTHAVYHELSARRVQFIVVQKELTEGVPKAYGVPIFDQGEPPNDDLHAIPVAAQTKFSTSAAFTMVYRSGTITIYRVNQAQVRAGAKSA